MPRTVSQKKRQVRAKVARMAAQLAVHAQKSDERAAANRTRTRRDTETWMPMHSFLNTIKPRSSDPRVRFNVRYGRVWSNFVREAIDGVRKLTTVYDVDPEQGIGTTYTFQMKFMHGDNWFDIVLGADRDDKGRVVRRIVICINADEDDATDDNAAMYDVTTHIATVHEWAPWMNEFFSACAQVDKHVPRPIVWPAWTYRESLYTRDRAATTIQAAARGMRNRTIAARRRAAASTITRAGRAYAYRPGGQLMRAAADRFARLT